MILMLSFVFRVPACSLEICNFKGRWLFFRRGVSRKRFNLPCFSGCEMMRHPFIQFLPSLAPRDEIQWNRMAADTKEAFQK